MSKVKVTSSDLRLIRREMQLASVENPSIVLLFEKGKISAKRMNWDLASAISVDQLLLRYYPLVDHDKLLAHVMHNGGKGGVEGKVYGPTCTLGNVLASVKRTSRYVDGR